MEFMETETKLEAIEITPMDIEIKYMVMEIAFVE